MNVCVPEPLLVMFAASMTAHGTPWSGTATLNVPNAPAGARFPEASLTWPAWSETV